jgi:hypothetical protein
MKILFFLDKWVNRGSIQAVANYVLAGAELGHVVAVYGQRDPAFPASGSQQKSMPSITPCSSSSRDWTG